MQLEEYKENLYLDKSFIKAINEASIYPIHIEDMMGTFYTIIKERTFYLTPFWEDSNGIAVEISTQTDGVVESEVLDFPVTGNISTDAILYVQIIVPYLQKKEEKIKREIESIIKNHNLGLL